MVKIIEFGCTHNNARSKHAEAYAIQRLEELARDGVDTTIFQVTSSGTRADAINDFLEGYNSRTDVEMRNMVEDGLKARIYQPREAQMLVEIKSKLALTPTDFEILIESARFANRRFVDSETYHRTRRFNIDGLIQPTKQRVQTVKKEGVALFLGLGDDNVVAAKAIYGPVDGTIFDTLARYATQNPNAHITSAYGKGYPEYHKMAEAIRGFTRKAIDRAVEELKD